MSENIFVQFNLQAMVSISILIIIVCRIACRKFCYSLCECIMWIHTLANFILHNHLSFQSAMNVVIEDQILYTPSKGMKVVDQSLDVLYSIPQVYTMNNRY